MIHKHDAPVDHEAPQPGALDTTLAALHRTMMTLHRQRRCSKVIINAQAQSEGYLKLEEELAEVVIENLSGGVVDVFLGADAGSLGFPDFSVATNQAKCVPLTTSGSTVVTIVPRTRTGVIRAWGSNESHGYGVWTISV